MYLPLENTKKTALLRAVQIAVPKKSHENEFLLIVLGLNELLIYLIRLKMTSYKDFHFN